VAKMTGKLKIPKKATATKQTPTKQKQVKTAKVAAQFFKSKFEPDATVTWAGKENPFREGSGAWERTEPEWMNG
jgi:hypothetical protein